MFLIILRFVTTRDEESMARSSDDVFLAEEESESFKQQVVVFLSYHSPILYHQYKNKILVSSPKTPKTGVARHFFAARHFSG